jgi:hypothetical protein
MTRSDPYVLAICRQLSRDLTSARPQAYRKRTQQQDKNERILPRDLTNGTGNKMVSLWIAMELANERIHPLTSSNHGGLHCSSDLISTWYIGPVAIRAVGVVPPGQMVPERDRSTR